MSENKKDRVMSARGWLHKTTTKAAASAGAFIAAHREWLEKGELAPLTSPILRKLDDRELMPTPALEVLKSVVLGYTLSKQANQIEERMAREATAREPKNWLATIYDQDGNICVRVKDDGEEETLQKEFDHPQDADGWTDRRLFDGESDWYGVVSHTTKTTKEGDPISFVIMRQDAMARILKSKKGPVIKKLGGDGKLSFGTKVKESHAKFSHG